MAGRRAARRTALFLLYQWDLTKQPLHSLYEGEADEFARETAEAVAARAGRSGGPRRRPMRSPEEHRALAEAYVSELALTPELGALEEAVRYALEGGKRIRAVLCLATAEAAGAEPEEALPAAAALELV